MDYEKAYRQAEQIQLAEAKEATRQTARYLLVAVTLVAMGMGLYALKHRLNPPGTHAACVYQMYKGVLCTIPQGA